MTARLPLVIGMLIVQAAGLSALLLAHPGSQTVVNAAVLVGLMQCMALAVSVAPNRQRPRWIGIVSETLGAIAGFVSLAFFLRIHNGEALAWGLAVLQAAINLRVRSRREILFSLLCGLGILLFATRGEWGIATTALLLIFAAGALLALAAGYYLEQIVRSEMPAQDNVRLVAPGVLGYGVMPALLLALPIIALAPEGEPHSLPIQIPAGGILYAEPPPAPSSENDGSGAGGLLAQLGAQWRSHGEEDSSANAGAVPGTSAGKIAGAGTVVGLGSTGNTGPGKAAMQTGQAVSPGGTGKGLAGAGTGVGNAGAAPGKGGAQTRQPSADGKSDWGPGTDPGDIPGGRANSSDDADDSADPGKAGDDANQGNRGPRNEPGSTRRNKSKPGDDKPDMRPVDPAAMKNANRKHPGGICVPRPPEEKPDIPQPTPPPRHDVCSFHVLNPYHNPALYLREPNPQSSTVLRVRSSAPVYLREQVYDRYENGTWQCSEGGETRIQRDRAGRFYIDNRDTKSVFPITVSVEKPISNLIPAALRPEFVRAAFPRLLYNADYAIAAPDAIDPGQRYYLESVINVWKDLRPTSDEDRSRPNPNLLQVPPALMPKLRQLALDITRGKRNSLDQGNAIERHIRQQYRHTLGKLALDGDQIEPLEDFLEGSRAGNAELFATAFVLAARAAGLRARLVVGYVAARKTLDSDDYAAHQLDAHTWAELFDGRNWTTFDPTPFRAVPKLDGPQGRWPRIVHTLNSLDDLARAFDEIVPDAAVPGTVWQAASTRNEQRLVQAWRILRWAFSHAWQLGIALFVAAGMTWLYVNQRNTIEYLMLTRRRLDTRTRIIQAYAALERLFSRRDFRRRTAENHATYIGHLCAIFPPLAPPLRLIGLEFGRARYGNSPITEEAAARAIGAYSSVLDEIDLFKPEKRRDAFEPAGLLEETEIPESVPSGKTETPQMTEPSGTRLDTHAATRSRGGFARRHR